MAAKPEVEPHFVFGVIILRTEDHKYVQHDGSLGDITSARPFDEPGDAEEFATLHGYPPMQST